MNKKLNYILVAVIFVLTFGQAQSQKIFYKANKQYQLKHYYEAIDSYLKTLESNPENLEAKENLAECYRITNQLTKAVEVYSQIMPEEFVDPIHIRNYGITLMKMAEYNKAHYQFELYKVYNPQDAQHYQLSCEFAHHLYKKEQSYELELVDVNSPKSDFGVAFIGDQMVFSSFNQQEKEASDDEIGNVLYTADLSRDLRASNAQILRSGIEEKRNIGPISYAPNGEICAFTRNKIIDGGAHVTGDDHYHSIYIADLTENGNWKNERPFRYNEFGTSTGFPCLAFDGSALYFASNRVGGFGGYDIYVSYYKSGSWTYPENLGEEINSPGNEITPFYDGNDLYFASDYHHGMGGYDIFQSKVIAGKWSHPQNMANGINSPGDDYYPAMKKGTKGLFFSSNRLGGYGLDDIYLAMPNQGQIELAQADFKPQAVNLSDRILEESSYQVDDIPSAKTVSTEDNEMQITVLSDPPSKEEELKPFGFAEAGEPKDVTKSHQAEDRKIEACDIIALELGNLNSTIEIKRVSSMDLLVDGGEKSEILDDYIAAMEIEGSVENKEVEAIASEQIIAEKETEEIAVVETEEVEATKPATFKIPNYTEVSPKNAPLNINLVGAKRVALGEILPTSEVYFIQLAALSRSTGNVSQYSNLAKYGNLYKVFKPTSTKIKLGYFLDKNEAQNVLKNVKARGFKDAFITKDDLNALQLELIIANDQQSTDYTSYSDKKTTEKSYDTDMTLNNPGRSNTYKIRLASYEDPIWFDIESAKTLGRIEQWTKGNWTIFILGGYQTFDEAEAARIKAVNKGFSDAEIVIDDNGILQRLKRN